MDETIEQLRAERDRLRQLWLRAADDRDAADAKLTQLDEQLERERDAAAAGWEAAAFWREACEARDAALAEERQEREVLIRFEVDRLTRQTPKRRGRPPSWSADAEAEVLRMHAGESSIRRIAAELHVSKTQVHRVIVRARRQQAEAAEHARLAAIASGGSPKQRAARAVAKAAGRRKIQPYDPARAERYLDSLPD